MKAKSRLLNILSILAIAATILMSVNLSSASAQGRDPIQRGQNAETGKVNFIRPASGDSLSFSEAMGLAPGAAKPADPAMALAKRFAPEFGLQNVENSLSLMKSEQSQNGRMTVKYQQIYEGIPVLGGELIVNTNQNGDLYSMNGEVASNLSIDTKPGIDSAQAMQIALEAMAKWNEKTPQDFAATEPELWVFDESLLQPSTRPATLVWRMDVTSVDGSLPIRELMLINAQTGNPDFHFNQVDTAWAGKFTSTNGELTSAQLQATWPLYFEIAFDEGRGWIYGSDSTGNKIDVISTTTLQLVKSINLAAGAAPQGIALSPDGSELAVAQRGAGSIIFVNPDTGSTIATLVPNVESALNQPFDVIYGRTGRMYSTGNPNSAGTDYIHVIDTATHLEVSRSSFIIRATPRLWISSDYNRLYANETFSPNKLYRFDISTDTISSPTGTPHTSGFNADPYFVLADESEIFTSVGQVWSNPSDLNLSTLARNLSGRPLIEIPSLGLVAVVGNAGSLNFVSTADFSTTTTVSRPSVSTFGPAVLSADEGMLFVSTEDGIIRLALGPALPSLITVVSGSNQVAKPSHPFGLPLKVKVVNFFGEPLAGIPVTFAGPASDVSVVFSDTGTNVTTVNTDSNGVATTSSLTANASEGEFVVQASVAGMDSHLDFELVTSVQQIRTHTANHGSSLPGALVCDEIAPNCTSGVNLDADSAHLHTTGTYNFYLNLYGRNSLDGFGMPLISTVQYCSPFSCPYANAFWNGAQMVYGDAYGYARADDVIAHELTHGVTENESDLFYFYQSGAINESFSDLWGEYYDQTNGQGTDAANVKWLMGEDVTGAGALRSMSNPPQFGDPDKMTSPLYNKKPYYDNSWDNGGVHTNSGVNNKAAFLMVDGGAFNGKTVTALGWEKTGAIYYEAQTNLLSSGSDYSDLYYALQQACTNLIGQHGITPNDCVEVRDALDAVQMNSQPIANFNPDAPMCPVGMTTSPSLSLFQEDFESGTANWSMDYQWSRDTIYATSPTHHMFGNDNYSWSDGSLTLNAIALPAGSTPFLRFRHAFAFEYSPPYFWDGGVVEYSTNNGSSWIDARTLFSGGQAYNGTIVNYAYASALGGRSGFVGDSHGYVSSLYNLTSLAGNNVKIRWHFATDISYDFYGWFLDDVQIYTCTGAPAIPALQVPTNNFLTTNFSPLLNWSDTTPALSSYQVQVDDDLWFHEPVIDTNTGTTSSYQIVTPLTANKTYYWRVRSLNSADGSLGWSAVWSFRTAYTPPTLLSPAAGASLLSLRPVFDWEDVAETGVTGYTIQISTSSTFVPISHTGNPVGSTYTPNVDLPRGFLYWRVQTKGPNGPSAWSEVRSYQGPNPPPAPVLTMPVNASLTTNYTPLFKWNVITMPVGASPFAYYQFQLDDNNDFSSPVVDDTTTLTDRLVPQYQYPTNPLVLPPLTANTTYYWRVRAADQFVVGGVNETSPWSAVWSLRTAYTPPTLVSPNNGFQTFSLRPTFDWNDVNEAGMTGYTIQFSNTSLFTAVLHTGNPVASTYTPITDLPKGFLYWRVQTKGPNGPSAWSEVRSYQGPSAIPTPVLTLPVNGSLTTNYTPLLKWNVVTMPAGSAPFAYYQLQLDDANDFATPLIDDTTTLTTRTISQFQVGSALDPNKTYFWRVRVVDQLVVGGVNESGAWSAVWSFRTAYTPPTLVSPAAGASLLSLRPVFDWEDVAETGVTGYTIQISTSSTFVPISHTGNPVGSTYTPNVDLPRGFLYWRVQTKGPNGPSAWSEVRSYQGPNPPPAPVLTMPVNASLTTNYTPLFKWNVITMPVGASPFAYYQFQLDDNNDFSSPVVDDTTTLTDRLVPQYQYPTNPLVLPPLTANTTYYWRVRAADQFVVGGVNETSLWSAVWSFRTAYTPPTLVSPNNGFQTFSLRPTFDWNDVSEAGMTGYTIQFSNSSLFTAVLHTGNPVASTYTPLTDLPKGFLYWRVQTKGPNGPSAWSEVRSYQGPSAIPTPVLTLPANGSLTTNYTPLLKWNVVTMPAGSAPFAYYQLQLDDANDFATPLIDDTTTLATRTVSQFQVGSALTANKTYFWRVRVVDQLVVGGVNESGAWSAVWSFRTAYTPPTLVSPDNGFQTFSLRPTFDWNDVSEAGMTGYTIQFSNTSLFTAVLHTGNPVASTYTPPTDLPKGMLYWRVQTKGPNGPSAWSEVRSYQGPSIIPTPVLTLPANGSLTTNYTPLLKWNVVTMPAGAALFAYYQLQLDDANDFATPLIDDTTTLTTRTISQFQVGSALDPNKTYFWRVRVVDQLVVGGVNETSPWSAVWSFRTAYTPPTLVSPNNGFQTFSLRPTFDWNDVNEAGMTGYTIQISTSSTFVPVSHTGNPVGSTYTPLTDLPKGSLYWRVQTKGPNGPSAWSEVRSYQGPSAIPTPVLTLPANGSLTTNYTPLLKWNVVTMPAGSAPFAYYQLQLDDANDFATPLIDDTTTLTTRTVSQFQISSALDPNKTYFWRVRVVDQLVVGGVNETSLWSAVWSFRTAYTPPTLVSPNNGFQTFSLRPTFDWNDVAETGVTGYTIQISTSSTFVPVSHIGNPVGSTYTPLTDLPKGLLYWRVQTKGPNGPSAWSEVRSYQGPSTLPAPLLTAPANASLTTNYSPLLKWNVVTMPAGSASFAYYQLQLDDANDFATPLIDDTTTLTTRTVSQFQVGSALDPNKTYFWRVRVVDQLVVGGVNESGAWSAVWSFRTAILPPVLSLPTNNATGVSILPLLDWDDVSGNTGYTLQIWKDGPTPTLVRTVVLTPNVSQYQFVTALLANTTYFWKVQTKAVNGPSIFSDPFYFTTAP